MSSVSQEITKRQEREAGRIYSVYAIRCRKNGRIYVGSTFDVQERIRQHFRELEQGRKTCGSYGKAPGMKKSQWQQDYDKYGKEEFEYYILENNIRPENRAEKEAAWINRLDSKAIGYNYHHAKRQPVPIRFVEGWPPELRVDRTL